MMFDVQNRIENACLYLLWNIFDSFDFQMPNCETKLSSVKTESS